jgi:chitinase
VGYSYGTSAPLPDPNLVTHINFSFAKIDSDFETLTISSSKQKRLKQIVALKQQNPDLKVMLSVGGWGAGNFSEMAADETHRKSFCKNCLKAVQDYGLDGIDIDWEYPGSSSAGISSSSSDKANFTKLMHDLRETLGNDRLLTMASEAGAGYIDWGSALQYMDFVNIMSYDMGKPPYHNAALYKSAKTKMSCDEAVAKHYAKGIPYNKMTLGMAFFGRVDRNILQGDELDYNEIINLTGFNRYWDDQAMVPYLTDAAGTMVLSYDDETSIGLKADYIKQKGLLGGMYWDIEADDANHTLGKAVASRLIGYGEENQEQNAFLATNQYVEKFMEEVNYPCKDNPDTDVEYDYSSVIGYPGGGPSENNIEIPPTYEITWTASSSNQKLTVWEDSWSREYSLSGGVGKQGITNLVPNTTYQWQVTTSSNQVVASGSFKTRGHLRQVFFEPNVRNGRDLGGYKGLNGKTVVYHKLFRGGKIHSSYCNSNGRKEMLAEGIKAEVDLRESSDVPDKSPLGTDIAFLAPGFDSGYNTMIRDNKDKMKDTFCWVVARLRENKPVYFHCAAGRDRTATLAILLEGALGVSESDMAKDYELTYFTPSDWGMSKDDNGNPVYKHIRTAYSYKSVRKTIYSLTDSGTYQERIVKYLLQIGVPQQDIDDLRAIMLR